MRREKMLLRLLDFLVCPICKNSLKLAVRLKEEENIVQGFLICPCGKSYPIVNSIPRILPEASFSNADQCRTMETFGFQWNIFNKMSSKFEDNFLNYIYPVKKDFFNGKLGLDAGCGFGRHIFYAAQFGAEMIGMDLSSAIDSTYANTKNFKNIHLVQCDIYNLPFKKETFDFIYSIGVLHHLPDPEKGFKSLAPFLKKDASIFVWVYSKRRKFANFIIETFRKLTRKLPLKLIFFVSYLLAFLEWVLLIMPYKMIRALGVPQKFADKIFFARIRLYSQYPFQVSCADWFDRLSPPIRFYYNCEELKQWFEGVKLVNIIISETGLYGVRGYGEKRNG